MILLDAPIDRPRPLDLTLDHPFRRMSGKMFDSGQTHSLVLTGAVNDLFYLPPDMTGNPTKYPNGRYLGLVDYLRARWGNSVHGDIVLITCATNGLITFMNEDQKNLVRQDWELVFPETPSEVAPVTPDSFLGSVINATQMALRPTPQPTAKKSDRLSANRFENFLNECLNRPTAALRLLKFFCERSRNATVESPLWNKKLLIIVESADLHIPEGQVSQLQEEDRRRVAMLCDWFSSVSFMHGKDSVVLIAESMSMLNRRVTSLPQVLSVEIPAPNLALRSHFIEWFDLLDPAELKLWGTKQELAELSAGLSLHALHQMLIASTHEDRPLEIDDVIQRVEAHIISQLGEGVVEFKRPTHRLDAVVGFTAVKKFIHEELIPGFKATNPEEALSGAAIAGSIGAGKTFVFEAVAAELDMLVLVLKNIRSKWFGETDLILERLYRVLVSLGKVMILMDEADTLLGGVGKDTHETERRATGKIQGWMSDPALRGKVVWLLMTARIHLLSPDIRRPGRVGDLIIPMLDPHGEDFDAFLRWTVKPVIGHDLGETETQAIATATKGYSAASFDALRRKLKRLKVRKKADLSIEEVITYIARQMPANIGVERRYQELQALINCTDRSLLPDPNASDKNRQAWEMEIRQLEAMGIS